MSESSANNYLHWNDTGLPCNVCHPLTCSSGQIVSVGRQAMAASASEGSVITDGRRCLASRSSPSAALGLTSGADCLLTDCELAVVHTITSARAASTCQLYAARWRVFSSWCEERGLDPICCEVPGFRQSSLHSESICCGHFCASCSC